MSGDAGQGRPAARPGIGRGLLSPGIAVAEGLIEGVGGTLWDAEAVLVASAVAKRRREFAAGRILARRALTALGAEDAPLLAGPDRAPLWPAGFVGSISHSDTYVVAAVARRRDVAGVGVDVEEVERFDAALERQILGRAEAARLAGLDAAARQAETATVFCAKEAFYKAQFPLLARAMGFQDVDVELDEGAGLFRARTVDGLAGEGRYAIADGLAAAALILPSGFVPEP